MDFEFPRGDTFPFPKAFGFTDENGQLLNITNSDKVYMTMRKSPQSKTKVLQKTINNGITIEDNYCYITLNANDTAELQYGTYGFDISLKTADGIVVTPVIGTITLTEEYTHKEDEV